MAAGLAGPLGLLRALVDPSGGRSAGQQLPEEASDRQEGPPPRTLEELLARRLHAWSARLARLEGRDAEPTGVDLGTAEGTGPPAFRFALACVDALLRVHRALADALADTNAAEEPTPLIPLAAYAQLTAALECAVVWGLAAHLPDGVGPPAEARGKHASRALGHSSIPAGKAADKTRYFKDDPAPLTDAQKLANLALAAGPLASLALLPAPEDPGAPPLPSQLLRSYLPDLLAATCYLSLRDHRSPHFASLVRALPADPLLPSLLPLIPPSAPTHFALRIRAALTYALFGRPGGAAPGIAALVKAMWPPDGTSPERALAAAAGAVCALPRAEVLQELSAAGLGLWTGEGWRNEWSAAVASGCLDLLDAFARDAADGRPKADDRPALGAAYLLSRLRAAHPRPFPRPLVRSRLAWPEHDARAAMLAVHRLGVFLRSLREEGGADPTPLNAAFVLGEMLSPLAARLCLLAVGLDGPQRVASPSEEEAREVLKEGAGDAAFAFLELLERSEGEEAAVRGAEMLWEAVSSAAAAGELGLEVRETEGGMELRRVEDGRADGKGEVRVAPPDSDDDDERAAADAMRTLSLSPSSSAPLAFARLLRAFSSRPGSGFVAGFFSWAADEWVRTASELRDSEEGEEDEEAGRRHARLAGLLMAMVSVFSEPAPGEAADDADPAPLKALLGNPARAARFARAALHAGSEALADAAVAALAGSLATDPAGLLGVEKGVLEELRMLLGIRGGGVEGALRTAIAAALAFREEEGPADGKAGEDGGDDADPVARSLADLKPGTMAPLKARGLSTLASLLRAEDPRVLKLGTPALAALGIAALADPEEFAYLHAVRFLAALAEADPERGIEALAGAFAGDGDVATRCKVGEVLMRVVVRQGEALGKLAPRFVPLFLHVLNASASPVKPSTASHPAPQQPSGDDNIALQSSALSLIAACLEVSFLACLPFLDTVADAALGVLRTERRHPQIRCAAVYLLASFVEGAGSMLESSPANDAGLDPKLLASIRAALEIVESGSGVLGEPDTEEDGIVRDHAKAALERLGMVAAGLPGRREGRGLNAAMWRRREGEASVVRGLLGDMVDGGSRKADIGLRVVEERRL